MANALPALSQESGLARYLAEIRKFPMLEPQEEYMLAKRWREHEDPEAAQKLITSHLRLVARVAMGYRGYGLPIGEIVSEGNVGLMQAVKRFEPERGFRLATYALWWIRASIQEYILRSWSLVKIGTTASQKKLFFNLRKAKSRISAYEEGDLKPENVTAIATRLGVSEQDVIDMNRRMSGDASLNAPLREEGEGEWQDWLVDDLRRPGISARRSRGGRQSPARALAAPSTCSTRASGASSRPGACRTIRSRSRRSPRNSASRASACARSRCAPSRRCRARCRPASPRSSAPARRRCSRRINRLISYRSNDQVRGMGFSLHEGSRGTETPARFFLRVPSR